MNYYWWKDIEGHAGNAYANSEEEVKEKVEKEWGIEVKGIELLKENAEFKGDKS